MPESVFCHACGATTTSEAYYTDAGDRVCPTCESDFIEISEVSAESSSAQTNTEAAGQQAGNNAHGGGRNQGFHRQFTTPAGHRVHLHVVTSMGGIPANLENLLSTAEPADLTTLLRNMQGVNLTPFNLPPGVSPGDYGPNGGQAFEDLLSQIAEAHQPQASPTSRDALSALPRRKVRKDKDTAGSEGFSNTPSDQPAACACGEPCSVCHDGMEEGLEVIELPCQHCYHEDCITAWLKDHNTCPVCRKALPVDEALQRQQQQERQQRLEQNMQRQPASLQSFFNAMNPFHLFGPGGRANGNTGPVNSEEMRRVGATRMPAGTLSRLERAERALRDLEGRLENQMQHTDAGSYSHVSRSTLQEQLEEVQFQDTMLGNVADHAMSSLWLDSADDSPTNRAADTAAVAEIAQAAEALVAEVAEAGVAEDAGTRSDPDSHFAEHDASHAFSDISDDLGLPAEIAVTAARSIPVHDDSDSMPDLVNSDDDSEADSLPELESNHDHDSVPGLASDHDSEGSDDLSAEDSDYDDDDDDNDDDDDDEDDDDVLPSLVDITPPRLPAATEASQGVNTPLDLDQQAALDSLSRQLDRTESLIASVSQVLDDAVTANQAPSDEQPIAPSTASDQPSESQPSAAHNSGSDQRRVVQRINSHSTPQNPAGPLQIQPSGLALATAPVSNPAGVILNHRSIDQASIDAELPRASSGLAELDANGDKHADLRSHPLTQTPSRKRSFTPSEASSSIEGTNSLSQESMGRPNTDDHSVTVRPRDEDSRRPGGGLIGFASVPVQWAARGAGRLVGTLFRRSSRQ